ncbi:hypothetical protein BJ983_003280 [Actinomycetospora corticicola]|uniref:Uncharacterized protein n=1 Tax=Actinomycetospora corticicola TaxID=663602 RepID=A0A7Y9J6F4_9PSEU|nr:hypothetical protein [Actinomycetospora corticicola]
MALLSAVTSRLRVPTEATPTGQSVRRLTHFSVPTHEAWPVGAVS